MEHELHQKQESQFSIKYAIKALSLDICVHEYCVTLQWFSGPSVIHDRTKCTWYEFNS